MLIHILIMLLFIDVWIFKSIFHMPKTVNLVVIFEDPPIFLCYQVLRACKLIPKKKCQT
jgi:hypothetical protein